MAGAVLVASERDLTELLVYGVLRSSDADRSIGALGTAYLLHNV
jgi:hypothetical protein